MARAIERERLVLDPEDRRETVLTVLQSARQRLALSLFRCDDFKLLDALAEALKRGVHVDVLLTGRAKGGRKRLKELATFLESIGAHVFRYADPVVKYHAKYILADDGTALVTTLNFTRKCFEDTCDFLLVTEDPPVVKGLRKLFDLDRTEAGAPLPGGLSDRLIVGPEGARDRFAALLKSARRSIHLIDHKVSDPTMVSLLKSKRAAGVSVQVLGRGAAGRLKSHGKMTIIDNSTAVIGSIALSSLSLDFRREVAVTITDRRLVRQLNDVFHSLLQTRAGRAGARAFAKELAS